MNSLNKEETWAEVVKRGKKRIAVAAARKGFNQDREVMTVTSETRSERGGRESQEGTRRSELRQTRGQQITLPHWTRQTI